jgi:hypothetical protein
VRRRGEEEGKVPSYRLLEQSAKALKTTPEVLGEFEANGWITTVEKNGNRYLAGSQEYKARFILSLQRRLHLNKKQISQILAEQRPPYSFEAASQLAAQMRERVQARRDDG